MRNLFPPLDAPVTNGLDGNAGGVRNAFRATAERFENLVNDMHGQLIIRQSDNTQAGFYPMLINAEDYPPCDIRLMIETDFNVEAIEAARKAAGATQAALAQAMKLPSQSAYSNILKGKRRVSTEEARRAYDFLGLRQLATIQMVPIIGITNAGHWREAIIMPLGELPIPTGKASEDSFALEVSGDSMDKLINDGGHVIIDPRDKELREGRSYLISNGDHEAMVKRYRTNPSRFEPVSTNPVHKAFLVSDCDFSVLGRVVMKIEQL